MADFAKAPEPTQDPNWMFFSRAGRENPKPNESGNILAEGIGKDLEEGSKLADSLQADNVKNKVFDAEQSERMDYISAANTLNDQQQKSPDNILQQDAAANAPTAVKNTIQQVQGIKTAMDAGKIDEKLYYQRVIPKLQAIRQAYPGYRDVVDQALGNNANEYMRTLTTELNERQSKASEEWNKTETQAMSWAKEGVFGGNTNLVLQGLKDKNIDRPTLLRLAMPQIQHDMWMKSQRENHEAQSWGDADIKKNADGVADKIVDNIQYGSVVWPKAVSDGMMHVGGGSSAQSDMQAIAAGAHNLSGVNEIEQRQHASNLAAYSAQIETEARQKLSQPMPGDRLGRSYGDIIGPAAVDEKIKNMLAIPQMYIKMVGDPKTYATGTAIAEIVTAQKDMDKGQIIANEDIGPPIRELSAVTGLLGPDGTAIFGMALHTGDITTRVNDGLAKLQMMKMWGQPDPNNPSTPGDAVKKAKDGGIEDPAYYKKVTMQQISLINDKKVPTDAKTKVLKGFFAPTPENRALLSYFNKDSYDPATGRYINGADTMFQWMTSPDVTKEVLKQKDPELAKNYRDTADAWFNNIYSREMTTLSQSLKNAQEFKSRGVVTGKTPEIKLTWDNTNHVLDFTPEARQYLKTTRQRDVLDSVNRVNMGLRNMGHIVETAKEAGDTTDFNAYMLQLLGTEGLSVNPEEKATIDTIRNAITASNKKQASAQ